MALKAGTLRHRVSIQEKVNTQDQETGEIIQVWVTIAGMESVPVAIQSLSVRELTAAQAVQSELSVKIIMRYRAGLNASMRIIHKDKVYNPAGFLTDNKTGMEYLVALCSEGVNDG